MSRSKSSIPTYTYTNRGSRPALQEAAAKSGEQSSEDSRSRKDLERLERRLRRSGSPLQNQNKRKRSEEELTIRVARSRTGSVSHYDESLIEFEPPFEATEVIQAVEAEIAAVMAVVMADVYAEVPQSTAATQERDIRSEGEGDSICLTDQPEVEHWTRFYTCKTAASYNELSRIANNHWTRLNNHAKLRWLCERLHAGIALNPEISKPLLEEFKMNFEHNIAQFMQISDKYDQHMVTLLIVIAGYFVTAGKISDQALGYYSFAAKLYQLAKSFVSIEDVNNFQTLNELGIHHSLCLKLTIGILEQQVASANIHIEKKSAEFIKIHQEFLDLTHLNLEIPLLRQKIAELVKQKDEASEQSRLEISELIKNIEAKSSNLADLHSQINLLRKHLFTIQEQVKIQELEIERVKTLESELKKEQEKNKELEEIAEYAKTEIPALQKKIEQTEKEKEKDAEQSRQLIQNIDAKDNSIISGLLSEKAVLQQQLDHWQTELQSQNSEIQHLRIRNSEYQGFMEDWEVLKQEMLVKSQENNTLLTSTKSELDETKISNKILSTHIDELTKENNQLQRVFQEIEDLNLHIIEDNEYAYSLVTRINAEMRSQDEQIYHQDGLLQDLDRETQQLKQTILDLEEEQKKNKTENGILRGKLSTVCEESTNKELAWKQSMEEKDKKIEQLVEELKAHDHIDNRKRMVVRAEKFLALFEAGPQRKSEKRKSASHKRDKQQSPRHSNASQDTSYPDTQRLFRSTEKKSESRKTDQQSSTPRGFKR